MDRLEQNMLRTAEFKPASCDRYVDDCLMVWNHGETELTRFLKHCNRQHPNIQFTWESSLFVNSVSFMDLQISVREDGQLNMIGQKNNKLKLFYFFNEKQKNFARLSLIWCASRGIDNFSLAQIHEPYGNGKVSIS